MNLVWPICSLAYSIIHGRNPPRHLSFPWKSVSVNLYIYLKTWYKTLCELESFKITYDKKVLFKSSILQLTLYMTVSLLAWYSITEKAVDLVVVSVIFRLKILITFLNHTITTWLLPGRSYPSTKYTHTHTHNDQNNWPADNQISLLFVKITDRSHFVVSVCFNNDHGRSSETKPGWLEEAQEEPG